MHDTLVDPDAASVNLFGVKSLEVKLGPWADLDKYCEVRPGTNTRAWCTEIIDIVGPLLLKKTVHSLN